MSKSFKNVKDLVFTITLGASTFGGGNNNVVELSGMKAVCDILNAGGMFMPQARMRIFGVAQDTMQQLTMLAWESMGIAKNIVQVHAVDGDSKTLVYDGTITNAWPDYQSAPDVFLHIEAQGFYWDQINPVEPSSYQGTVDAATVIADICKDMGAEFENNGVNVKLSNPYFPGTNLEKIKAVVDAAGIDMYTEGNVIAICYRNQPRQKDTIPLVGPETGLIGYPVFGRLGVTFNTLFNPSIMFGGKVKIDTEVKPAAGVWAVTGLSHYLSSQAPNGPWFSEIKCTETGLVPVK